MLPNARGRVVLEPSSPGIGMIGEPLELGWVDPAWRPWGWWFAIVVCSGSVRFLSRSLGFRIRARRRSAASGSGYVAKGAILAEVIVQGDSVGFAVRSIGTQFVKGSDADPG